MEYNSPAERENCINKTIDSLFPPSEWNNYITEVNKKVIALDNDREAQYQYIMKEFYKMSDERKWDKGVVVDWYKSQMHVIGKHELADVFDFMALYTQPVIGLDVMTKLINDSFYGASDYKEGEPTDGLEWYINKHWTIEEVRERLKEAHINATDEMVQMMFDAIIKVQTEHGIDNDSFTE